MTTDLSTVLKAVHLDLEGLLHEVETSPASPEHRRQLADHVITELVAHAVAQEQHLYPAVRRHLPDGDRIVETRLKEHAETEQAMTELQNMSPANAQFELLLSKLTIETRRHIEDTETVLLPGLEKSCPAAELADIGAKLLHTRQIAPGRPHPATAERKSGELILDPGEPLVQKVRNTLTQQQ